MASTQFSRRIHNFVDLTGNRFGRWTVIERAAGLKCVKWFCVCDCGSTRIVIGASLKRGISVSCGCFALEVRTKYPKQQRREYRIWHAARQRCHDSKNRVFESYGGRGIVMCDRWRMSFHNFFADMGPCPEGLTLDRIDNDGPYAPGNCRWTNMTVQQSNKRNTVFATHNGETLTVKEWSRRSGERYRTLLYRLRCGLPIFYRQRKRRYS